MPTIRPATPHDAQSLAQLAEETFRATFGAMNTAENMALHCQTNYSEAIQAREIANPHMLTLLCEEDGRLIGFAQLHWGEAPPCVSATHPTEIQRFYLAQDWHGQGIAPMLMNACLAEAQQRGSDVVWLGVWEHNPRAISFYQKCGFVEVGDHVFPVGHDPQRDIVMVRPSMA
ncbi:MAG: GNAT family N-acetyltransferase [Chloroflexi bacterium]|nr:GNAT family N-acetyltransferase [Chloroflexota bacterium]